MAVIDAPLPMMTVGVPAVAGGGGERLPDPVVIGVVLPVASPGELVVDVDLDV